MTSFWSVYITFLVVITMIGCVLLLIYTRKNTIKIEEGKELDHAFDGIKELNNPLPSWWLWLFIITIVFGAVYLLLYPGLGNFKGVLNWSSAKQWNADMEEANQQYGPIFSKLSKIPVEQLSKDPEALEIGQRLFSNNCAVCHGSDARGAKGFPNLTDKVWLYGGEPDKIETSILHGRQGMMPPMIGAVGGEEGVLAVTQYILSLNGQKYDVEKAKIGKEKYMTICFACHGPNATGNPLIGAPNLTVNTWLYGGRAETIKETITYGRQGTMPAHEQLLGKEKVHILAAYVYSLSKHNNP